MSNASDYLIEQDWPGYSEEEHAIWRLLFERQQLLLSGRACGNTWTGYKGSGSPPRVKPVA